MRMKLVPMARELDTASASPMYLSSTMAYVDSYISPLRKAKMW